MPMIKSGDEAPSDGHEYIALRFDPEPGGDGLPIVDEKVPVTLLYGYIYRLEGSSAFGEVFLGDTIEVEPVPHHSFRLVRVVERSGYRVHFVGVPRTVAESEELAQLFAAVEDVGGAWERIMGGILIFHLPQEAALDLNSALEEVYGAVAPRQESVPPATHPWWKVWTRLRLRTKRFS